MATTENITVLFTDLVGSTELASSLTPEAGRRGAPQALLGPPPGHRHLRGHRGQEPGRRPHGRLPRRPRRPWPVRWPCSRPSTATTPSAERPLGLRVGLSAGEATREADDYFGDPVIEAARLCATSRGRTDPGLRSCAGQRRSAKRHTFTSLGELELKGLPEPIETLEVGWEPLGRRRTWIGQGAASHPPDPSPRRRGHRPRERARPPGRRRQAGGRPARDGSWSSWPGNPARERPPSCPSSPGRRTRRA